MYISTNFRVGETVYFTDNGCTVIRADIREIRVTQYASSQHVAYLLRWSHSDSEGEMERGESGLYRSADAAFRAWDSANPQAEPELEAVAA